MKNLISLIAATLLATPLVSCTNEEQEIKVYTVAKVSKERNPRSDLAKSLAVVIAELEKHAANLSSSETIMGSPKTLTDQAKKSLTNQLKENSLNSNVRAN